MHINMRCVCGARLVLEEVPEDWAVGVGSMFLAAHADTCGYASVAPDTAERADTSIFDELPAADDDNAAGGEG